jgi:hypothetical protein
MAEYQIEHKIGTLALLHDPFAYAGFEFGQWEYTEASGPTGDAWVAKRVVVANTAQEAVSRFRGELFPIVDKVAFLGQCFAVAEFQPFSIFKRYDDDYRILFFRWYRGAKGVPLTFGDEQMRSLAALENYELRGKVFNRMREAANATTFSARFSMLVSALEAIAGQKDLGKGRLTTDRDYIADEVLQDREFTRSIFGWVLDGCWVLTVQLRRAVC